MFLAQARLTPGFHVTIVADLNVAKAREALATTGWPAEQVAAADLGSALKSGATWVTDDSAAIFAAAENAVVMDATGPPPDGIRHERLARQSGQDLVQGRSEEGSVGKGCVVTSRAGWSTKM